MSTQTSVKQRVFKLSPPIGPTTLVTFEKNFKNSRGEYGLAGEELSSGIPYNRELEIKRTTYIDKVMNADGTIEETVRPWNKTATAEMQERNKAKVIQNRDYDKFVGPLWKDFHEVITHPVLDRIKSDDKTKYENAQRDLNNLHLMQLVRRACHGLSRNRIKALLADWDKYFQLDQKFETFVVKHEEKKDAVVSAGKIISDNEFCVHLRDRTNVSFGQAAVPEAYNKNPDHPDFPTYAVFRAKCFEASQALAIIQGQLPKDKDDHNKKGQGKGQNNNQKNQGEKRPVDDAIAVMSAKVLESVQKHLKENGFTQVTKKAKTGASTGKDTTADTEAIFDSFCWNCDKTGHAFFKCRGEKATCTTCKAKGHCAKYHDQWKAHMDRRAAARAEKEKNSAPVKKASSVKVVPYEDDIPTAHGKSVRVEAEPQNHTFAERGIIGNYLQAVTMGRTFSVRVSHDSDALSVQGTAVDSDSNHVSEEAEEAVDGEDPELPTHSTAAIEHKPSANEGDRSGDEGSVTREREEIGDRYSANHSDREDASHADDFSDLYRDSSGSDDDGSYQKVEKRKRGKRNRNSREPSPEPREGAVTRARSRSNSLNSSESKHKPKPASVRKPPTPRSPSQAAGAKYKPNKGESPPDDSTEGENYFPYRCPSYSQFPPRTLPASEQDIKEQEEADRRHFLVDVNNRDGLAKYYACLHKKADYIESLLAFTNNQPYLAKGLPTNVSASVQAARKSCAHFYKKFVDNTAPKDRFPSQARDSDEQAKWFGRLHQAAVSRTNHLRAMCSGIDDMFESERGRSFWEQFTGTLDPILPWGILSQTWLTGGKDDPLQRLETEEGEEPDPSIVKARKSARLSRLMPSQVQIEERHHPVKRTHFTDLSKDNSPVDAKLKNASRGESFDIWVEEEERLAAEAREASAEEERRKRLKEEERQEESRQRALLREAEAQREADAQIAADNARYQEAAQHLNKRDKNPEKPAATIGNKRGNFGAYPNSLGSAGKSKSPERKSSRSDSVPKNKPVAKSSSKTATVTPAKKSEDEQSDRPISKRPVINLADSGSEASFDSKEDRRLSADRKANVKGGTRHKETQREQVERENPSVRDSRRRSPSPRLQHDSRLRNEREDKNGIRITTGATHDFSSQQVFPKDRDDRSKEPRRSDSRDRRHTDSRQNSGTAHSRRDSRDRESARNHRSPPQPTVSQPKADHRAQDNRGGSPPYSAARSAEQNRSGKGYEAEDHRSKKPKYSPSHDRPAAQPANDRAPEMLDDRNRTVKYYKKFDRAKLHAAGLDLKPFRIGNRDLFAAKGKRDFLSTEMLVEMLRFIDRDESSSSNPQMVNLLLETEFDLNMQRVVQKKQMIAEEVRDGSAFTLHDTTPVNREGDVVIDSGATVTLAKSTKGLRNFLDEKRRLRLLTAGGDHLHSEKVGRLKGMGTVVVSRGAADNLLSVLQVCRANSRVKFEFQGVTATIYHPGLEAPLRATIGPDDQYTLKQQDFQTLQRVLGDEARTFTVTTDQEPVEDLEEAMSSTSVSNPEPTPSSTSKVTAKEPTQQVLHDTIPPLPLTKQQLARAKEVRQLHMCLGHPSDETLIQSLTNGAIVGTHLTARDVNNAVKALGECAACTVGKTHATSHYESLSEPAEKVGEKVYVDLVPVTREDSNDKDPQYGGYTQLLVAVDAFSNFLHVVPCISKKPDDIMTSLRQIRADYSRYKHEIIQITADSEPCFRALNTPLGEEHTVLQLTIPYEHNKRVERQVQTLHARVRAIRAHSQVTFPLKLEGELTQAAAYGLNDVVNTKHSSQSPRMIFEGVRADMRKRSLIPVGTVVMVPTTEDKEQRARLAVTLGPSVLTYGANKYFVLDTERVVTSAKVIVQQYIPKDFPWKVKTGSHQFTVMKKDKKQKKSEKKQTKRKTATNNDATNAAQLQRDTTDNIPAKPRKERPVSTGREGETAESQATVEMTESREVEEGANVVIPQQSKQPGREWNYEEAMSTAQKAAVAKKLLVLQQRMLKQQELRAREMAVLQNEFVRTNRALAGLGPTSGEPNEQSPTVQVSNTEPLAEKTGASPSHTDERVEGVTEQTEPATPGPKGKKGNAMKAKATKESAARSVEASDSSKPPEVTAIPAKTWTNPPADPPPSRKSARQEQQKLSRAEAEVQKRMRQAEAKSIRLLAKMYRISVAQALAGEYAQESKEAIICEIQNMLQYRVGHYIRQKDVPHDKLKNILQSFMFLKHKTLPDGSYDKTKARMVGNGASQKEHMYDMVSSSTVALASVFLLMNIASYHKAKITTYDIKGAFLHAEFKDDDEVTYIRINKEVTSLWIEQDPTAAPFVDERGTLLLELDKFIYGLKQSPLKFQLLLKQKLTEMGYVQTGQDECIYMKRDGPDSFSILSTHVDDIMQVATHENYYSELKSGLIKAFGDITESEEGSAYLGMTIERDVNDRRLIKVSQKGLIEKILDRYPKEAGDRHRYFSPSSDDLFSVTGDTSAVEATEAQRREFLSVLMTLMYCARLTRPDILMPVTFLASRTHCATDRDIKHLMRIVRYLGETKDLCLHIRCDSLQVRCKCDASFATHGPDDSAYGHTGYIVGLGESMSYVHSRSGKQKVASTSSTDAEIIAMCEALKNCVWIRELLRELKFPLEEIVLYQDNTSAMTLGTDPSTPKRSKHMLTKLTYVRSLVLSGAVRMEHLQTLEMTADVLSKPLHGEQYYKHTKSMLGLRWSKDRCPFPAVGKRKRVEADSSARVQSAKSVRTEKDEDSKRIENARRHGAWMARRRRRLNKK